MRRSTVVSLLLLLVMAGIYYYLNNREGSADVAPPTMESESQISYLFTAEDGLPTSIRIEAMTEEKVEIARDAEGAWVLMFPIEAKADQGSAEAAASQVTTMRILDRVPDVEPEIVGLEVPEYTLVIQFGRAVERKAEFGVITPTESGYYVRTDSGEIVIVSKSSVDSLLALLATPPYLETPTPSPIPATGTPLPASRTLEAGTLPAETPTAVP